MEVLLDANVGVLQPHLKQSEQNEKISEKQGLSQEQEVKNKVRRVSQVGPIQEIQKDHYGHLPDMVAVNLRKRCKKVQRTYTNSTRFLSEIVSWIYISDDDELFKIILTKITNKLYSH